jgi:hypothetical protein
MPSLPNAFSAISAAPTSSPSGRHAAGILDVITGQRADHAEGSPEMTDMSGASWEHAAEARQALNAIVSDPQHGVAALSSAQTMSNLLKDLLPDAPREKSILVAAAEAGLADTLRQHVSQGMDPDTAIRLTASSFSTSTPFTPEACSWVTGEIATALGMSHSEPAGAGSAAGALGGTPASFDPIGQAAPTQIAPIPGYAPPPQPAQGPAAPPQGGAGAAATAPWPAGRPRSGQPGGVPGQAQPGGGFGGQPAGAPWQGQPQPGGFGQAQPGAGFGQAQPGAGFGQAQPGAGFGQPGAGQPGGGWQAAAPGGYAPGGYQPGAPGGPMGPIIPGGPGGPVRPRGRGRGLAIGGGIVGVAVVAIVIAASLSGGHKPNPTPPPTTPPPATTAPPSSAPATSPAAAHPPGTEALVTIMNPAGQTPVGTDCSTAKLFGLDASTIDASTFCFHSHKTPNVEVWGYQFDSFAHYEAGLKQINKFVGFDSATPGTSCPPSSGSTEGKVGWHAIHNPRYFRRSGQDIECLVDGNKPVLIWTMPSQDAFFIGQDRLTGSSLATLINWWKKLSYG